MNRAKLKTYAPKARKDFLQAVSDRARKVGLTLGHTEPVEVRGDVAIISGQAFPKRVADQRRRLDEQIKRKGFTAVMEEAAYTWFNRFMAIRYMELHGYLEHGYRVLSDPSGKDRPQILEQAEKVTLPGLDTGTVIDLKLDGTKDEELYKLLLLGQCHALHLAMPFLFERIDDQTELLLPDNLLANDSVVRRMVTEIAEVDWERVEIIGWLYQFYISEKKDALMSAKKAYASEDIPAVTQLFTPNWIVKYMVQNSLGRQWLATYPQSPLRAQMEYYIEPAEQTEEVNAQLAAITPKELDPEALTLIDPAVGSGHILVEAYDVFKEVYLERGYRLRDIPRLILEKNLFGLEIDDRAAQMAGFALLMKARADDARILDRVPMLNVRAIQSSSGLDAVLLTSALLAPRHIELMPSRELFPELNTQPMLAAVETSPVRAANIAELCALFGEAKTFGSLLTVPAEVAAVLPALRELISSCRRGGDMLASQAADDLEPLVAQAEFLARQYHATVTNPPYMGSKYFSQPLKNFTAKNFSAGKYDLYGCFIERCLEFTFPNGFFALITIPNWMFLSTFEDLRNLLFQDTFFLSLVHNGRGVFGSDFGSCAFTSSKYSLRNYSATFKRLFDQQGSVLQSEELSRRFFSMPPYYASLQDLEKIPGRPISYWVSDLVKNTFLMFLPLAQSARLRQGMSTTDSDRFVRCWSEIDMERIDFSSSSAIASNKIGKYWFPFNKGGVFRKWYGNIDQVVRYDNNGETLISLVKEKYPRISDPEFVIKNRNHYFKEYVSYSSISL